MKNHMLVVLAAGLILGAAACQPPSAPAPTATPTPLPQPTATPAPVATATPQPTSTPPPVMRGADLSGDGDKLTRPLVFEPGVIRMLATHGGAGDFLVQIVTPDGPTIPAFAAQGEYTGAVAFRVSQTDGADLAPGDYQVRVATTGPWTISVRQQTWSKGQPPPFTMTRTGSTVLSPIRLDDGAVRVTFSYKGESPFTARLLRQDGESAAVVGEATGPAESERSLTVGADASADLASGIYLLAVVSGGEWTVSMTPP